MTRKIFLSYAFNLPDAFYETGGNFIDTANVYQNKQSKQ
ncbi:hypothetical protein PENANT_c002G09846 [Penicillium antarcticum]|uniref:NADP-dependent oxidoreductase domain-containing protein n=1 Tax=Penicillium antarcticum TaxID=416450 RepID=A0A1V6QKM9_9EURO|nr:hypothetical protein PENANT_c002G09846 [Penicillium antarcticum]